MLHSKEVFIDQEAVLSAVFTFPISLMSTDGRTSRIFFAVKVESELLVLIFQNC